MNVQSLSQVKILKDSITVNGDRLTTLQLRYWRPIHSELMTHRMFSRNAGSSRARPVKAIIEQVQNNPWGPQEWGKNQPGMVAEEVFKGDMVEVMKEDWTMAAINASIMAAELAHLNVHKQIINRLLEPFTYIDVVVSATDWDNFFKLRLAPDAQPEMQELAKHIKTVMDESEPTLLYKDEWHLPYIDPETLEHYSLEDCQRISAARCARVSYKPFDSDRADPEKDLALFSKLSGGYHLSPMEHVARATDSTNYYANFKGWQSFRNIFEETLK